MTCRPGRRAWRAEWTAAKRTRPDIREGVDSHLADKLLDRKGGFMPNRLHLPERHPVRDFFIADILDWALKDDRHTTEHPIFSLSKTPDRKVTMESTSQWRRAHMDARPFGIKMSYFTA